MLAPLFKLAASSLAYFAISQWAAGPGQRLNSRRLRFVLMGAGLVLGGIAVGVVSVIILILALFFKLADFDALVMPALITALVSILIALLAWIEGWRFFRRP